MGEGIRMVDTAFDYYNQAGVGQGIQKSGIPRKEIFVETKAPGCGFDSTSTSHCYNDTKRILEEDLSLLNLTYVDLVILHMPPQQTMILRGCAFDCKQVQDQWRALEEFYDAGKTRAIGVSNYCPSCFKCLDSTAKTYPMVNQVGYHIGMGPDNGGFKSFADKKGIVLQAYSSLGNTPAKSGPNPKILTGNFTTTLARAHNKSTVQVALKWLVQHGIPAVTKSSNPLHLAADNDLWSWNLTQAEMDEADKYKLFGMPSFACNYMNDAEMLV